jgi:HSP20 family protein
VAINPYRPSDPINPFEALFGTFGGSRMPDVIRTPSADVIERENEIEVDMEIPGMRPEGLSIDLENNVLTVSGEKREERDEEQDGGKYHLAERRYGRFSRSFVLPRDVESDLIQARCEEGLLKIVVPKSERARRRRIEVQGGAGGGRRIEAESVGSSEREGERGSQQAGRD